MTKRVVAAVAAAMFGLGILAAVGGSALAGTPVEAAVVATIDDCIAMMGGSGAMGPMMGGSGAIGPMMGGSGAMGPMMGGSGAMGPQDMPDGSAMPGPGHDLHHPSASQAAEPGR